MDHAFSFTFTRSESIAPGTELELTAEIECIAEIEGDDVDPGEWCAASFQVRDAYAPEGTDYSCVAAGTPLHAALTKHCHGTIAEDIAERWMLQHPMPADCGYGHLQRELL